MELTSTFNAAASGGEGISADSGEGQGTAPDAASSESAESSTASGLTDEFNQAAAPPPPPGGEPAVEQEHGEGFDDDPEPSRPAPTVAQEELDQSNGQPHNTTPPAPPKPVELTAEQLEAEREMLEKGRAKPVFTHELRPDGPAFGMIRSDLEDQREARIAEITDRLNNMEEEEGLDNGDDDGMGI